MSPFGATILRVMLGSVYIAHGYYAFGVLTPETVAVMINKQLGLQVGDYLTTYILIAQFAGGAMLILGVFVRWAAMANLPILFAAVLLFHIEQGFFLHAVITDVSRGKAEVMGYEYALFILAATASQLFLGPGAMAMTRR